MQRHVHRTITTCFLIAMMCYTTAHAQQIINISAGSNFYISNGTTVSFDSLVLTPSAGYNISGSNSITRSSSLTNTSPNTFVTRTYRPATALTAYSGSIGVYYQSSQLNSLNASQLQLNIYGAGDWSNYTSTTGSNFATASGLSNVSIGEVALASSLSPLPVRWQSVTIRQVNSLNEISFTTTGEQFCKQFTVQRSTDGRQWSDASGSIAPNNTPGSHTYRWIDSAVYTGIVHYRICQQSVDNAFSYSISVIARQSSTTSLTIFPNPAVDRLYIATGKTIAGVLVYNNIGQVQLNNTGIMAASHSLNVHPLPKGRYTVLVTFADGSTGTHAFIKQ
jgi:hypothetical protein